MSAFAMFVMVIIGLAVFGFFVKHQKKPQRRVKVRPIAPLRVTSQPSVVNATANLTPYVTERPDCFEYTGPAPNEFTSSRVIYRIPKDKSLWIQMSKDETMNFRYEYNIKTRKWKDGFSPFYSRIPSKFIMILEERWIRHNGPIPSGKRGMTNIEVKIDFYKKEIRLKYEALAVLIDNIMVRSSNDTNDYTVNLSTLTCSCPDFMDKRSSLAKINPGRLCKHLVRCLCEDWEHGKNYVDDDIVSLELHDLYELGKGMPLKAIYGKAIARLGNGEQVEFYLILSETDWVSIHFPSDSTGKLFSRYGYSISERRWAYGESPFSGGTKRSANSELHRICVELRNRFC